MKSQDWIDPEQQRQTTIAWLIQTATQHGLDYEFTEDKFIIKLPGSNKAGLSIITKTKTRKSFDVSKWGDKGVDETLPTELPPTTTPLEEGKPPEGDDEK